MAASQLSQLEREREDRSPYRASQQRGSSFNRRGSGRYGQRGRGARAGDDNSQAERGAEKGAAFSASVEVNSANIEKGNENRIEWILDSGCTDHVINNSNYFNDLIVLKEPINVRVDDGRILKATKVGHVKSKFKRLNEIIEIEMKNFFLC